MSLPVSILERAFTLARSGSCQTLQDITKKLKAEGYEGSDYHMSGRELKRQLRILSAESFIKQQGVVETSTKPDVSKRKAGRPPLKAKEEALLR